MNPHRLTWTFAFSMPFAQMVAIATVAGMFLSRDIERRPIPWLRETRLLFGLWVIYTLTTLVALYPDEAWPQLMKVSKVLLFTFLTLMFFQSRERLRYLFLVLALSIGFFGLKGGLWVLRTGGVHNVLGPENTFIGGNTEIGLALNMTLPFLLFLAREEPRRWLRRLMLVTFAFSIVAIIFTYSRGAILTLPVTLMMLFLHARKRLVGLVALGLLALFVTHYPPEHWFSRVATIERYEEDASAMGRLTSWRVAWGLALDRPLTGGGFWALPHKEIFQRYAPGYPDVHSAHSIYFAVLGDHGFPGLALFVGLLVSCFVSLRTLRRNLANEPEAAWLVNYSRMIEASLVAYAVGGAFLTQAYWDLFYHLVSFVILLKVLARQAGFTVERVPAFPAVTKRLAAVTAGRARADSDRSWRGGR
jgi:probable O-glycosylation ligase (exosortase A-associated)